MLNQYQKLMNINQRSKLSFNPSSLSINSKVYQNIRDKKTTSNFSTICPNRKCISLDKSALFQQKKQPTYYESSTTTTSNQKYTSEQPMFTKKPTVNYTFQHNKSETNFNNFSSQKLTRDYSFSYLNLRTNNNKSNNSLVVSTNLSTSLNNLNNISKEGGVNLIRDLKANYSLDKLTNQKQKTIEPFSTDYLSMNNNLKVRPISNTNLHINNNTNTNPNINTKTDTTSNTITKDIVDSQLNNTNNNNTITNTTNDSTKNKKNLNINININNIHNINNNQTISETTPTNSKNVSVNNTSSHINIITKDQPLKLKKEVIHSSTLPNKNNFNTSSINNDKIMKYINEIEIKLDNNLKENKTNSKSRKYNILKHTFEDLLNLMNNKTLSCFVGSNLNHLLQRLLFGYHEVVTAFCNENKDFKEKSDNLLNELNKQKEINNSNVSLLSIKNKEIENLQFKLQNVMNIHNNSNLNSNMNTNRIETFQLNLNTKKNKEILEINKDNVSDLDALYFFDKIEMNSTKGRSQRSGTAIPDLHINASIVDSTSHNNKKVKAFDNKNNINNNTKLQLVNTNNNANINNNTHMINLLKQQIQNM